MDRTPPKGSFERMADVPGRMRDINTNLWKESVSCCGRPEISGRSGDDGSGEGRRRSDGERGAVGKLPTARKLSRDASRRIWFRFLQDDGRPVRVPAQVQPGINQHRRRDSRGNVGRRAKTAPIRGVMGFIRMMLWGVGMPVSTVRMRMRMVRVNEPGSLEKHM